MSLLPKWPSSFDFTLSEPLLKTRGGGGKYRPIRHNKEQHQSSYRRQSIGALGATWGCQRDGLDGAGEHLSGCKAGKQIKRDELQLGGLLLASWSSVTDHESAKAVWSSVTTKEETAKI